MKDKKKSYKVTIRRSNGRLFKIMTIECSKYGVKAKRQELERKYDSKFYYIVIEEKV